MKSWLQVESEHLDETLIAKHLQLIGEFFDSHWSFQMPPKLMDKSAESHLQYWVNLLDKHIEGKRVLQRYGYTFTIFLKSTRHDPKLLTLTSQNIDLISRHHINITFEFPSIHATEQDIGATGDKVVC